MRMTISKNILKYVAIVVGAVLLISCETKTGKETDLINSYNRTELLNNVGKLCIMPAYNSYYSSVVKMEMDFSSFVQNPKNTSLETLRTSWELCLLSWQEIAFLEFGPAADISLRSQTNLFPVDTSLINSNVKLGNSNLAIASNFAAKGLQTIDYLLFHPDYNDAALLTYLSSNESVKYLEKVIIDLKENAKYVNDQWRTYINLFISNSESNADGTSMSNIVNALSIHFEANVRKGKIGIPSGVFNGFSQQVMPAHTEAYFSGKSLVFARKSMDAIEKFYKGVSYANNNDGEGLDDYLNYVEAKKGSEFLDELIKSQFTAIGTALSALNDPLSAEVLNNKEGVSNCYQEMQKMVSLIKVDLTSSLGVLVNYQDTDGD